MSAAFTPFVMAGLALTLVGLVARAMRRIPDHGYWGIMCLSQIMVGISGFLTHSTVAASIVSAGAAYTGWKWWTGGGDDDTKRRLRKVARHFRGVRRTAPAGAR